MYDSPDGSTYIFVFLDNSTPVCSFPFVGKPRNDFSGTSFWMVAGKRAEQREESSRRKICWRRKEFTCKVQSEALILLLRFMVYDTISIAKTHFIRLSARPKDFYRNIIELIKDACVDWYFMIKFFEYYSLEDKLVFVKFVEELEDTATCETFLSNVCLQSTIQSLILWSN